MQTEIKERPFPAKEHEVRGILDGRQTVFRRIVKPLPLPNIKYLDVLPLGTDSFFHPHGECGWLPSKQWEFLERWPTADGPKMVTYRKCPYGVPGDRLWVKEVHWLYGYWSRRGLTKTGKEKWSFQRCAGRCYFSPYHIQKEILRNGHHAKGWYKRSPLFLEKEDSRITLEVVSVRAERLQDISEEDAVKEGIQKGEFGWIDCTDTGNFVDTAKRAFYKLWNSINGPDSWELNQWVWRVEFKKVD